MYIIFSRQSKWSRFNDYSRSASSLSYYRLGHSCHHYSSHYNSFSFYEKALHFRSNHKVLYYQRSINLGFTMFLLPHIPSSILANFLNGFSCFPRNFCRNNKFLSVYYCKICNNNLRLENYFRAFLR